MRGTRGVSLAELLAVMAIMGVLAAIAAPRLSGYVARMRVRGALDAFAGDVAYARMIAVRSGRGAVVRFERAPECAEVGPRGGGLSYVVAVRGDTSEASAARRTRIRMAGGGRVCVAMNGATDSLAFNSRGLLAPFNNRTVWGVEGRWRDSLSISVLGRVYRRY